MRAANSTDFFVRSPANSIVLRRGFRAKSETETSTEYEFFVDTRINQENFTRSVSVHIPNENSRVVSNTLKALGPKIADIADLKDPGGELIIGRSPDVAPASGLRIENGPSLNISVQAPWISEAIPASRFTISSVIKVYCDCDENDSELKSASILYKGNGYTLVFLGNSFIDCSTRSESPAYFVSYDSKNKIELAKPLALALSQLGEFVWFDEFSIKPGDNIREKIENGLRKCQQCVLLVSEDFLRNESWARNEFDAILSHETAENRKIIIPVWVDVTRDQVSEFSLMLANKFAVSCTQNDFDSPERLGRIAHQITTGRTTEE